MREQVVLIISKQDPSAPFTEIQNEIHARNDVQSTNLNSRQIVGADHQLSICLYFSLVKNLTQWQMIWKK